MDCCPFDSQVYVNSKTPKNSHTRKNYGNDPKICLIWIFHRVMCPNYADEMQTVQSDLGLNCLLRPDCPKI